jgi:hypothetical protein
MMLFPARSEAIHCSKNRMPKIRLPDNPITFQVFTSIIKKENVPNADIFRYRIELLPSQEGGFLVGAASLSEWTGCDRLIDTKLRGWRDQKPQSPSFGMAPATPTRRQVPTCVRAANVDL